MVSGDEVDAAFRVAAEKSQWSINKLPIVKEMLEAAERIRKEKQKE